MKFWLTEKNDWLGKVCEITIILAVLLVLIDTIFPVYTCNENIVMCTVGLTYFLIRGRLERIENNIKQLKKQDTEFHYVVDKSTKRYG